MSTALDTDTDVELFQMLENSVEHHCEGEKHPSLTYGHKDDSGLFYIQFNCACKSSLGVVIRCGGWIENRRIARAQVVHGYCGDCKMRISALDWFTVLGPVE